MGEGGKVGGHMGKRWQGDDPICFSSVGVSSDLMGKFELYGGMFLDWEGRGELLMEHGMGSGKDNYDRGGGGR